MQKIYFTFVVTLFFTVSVCAQNKDEIKFQKEDYASFQKKALKSKTPYFVYFFADWCAPCKKLKQETFSKPNFISFINTNFASYGVDASLFSGMDISEKYGIVSYPTILIFDSKGEVLENIKGFYTSKDLIAKITKLTPTSTKETTSKKKRRKRKKKRKH